MYLYWLGQANCVASRLSLPSELSCCHLRLSLAVTAIRLQLQATAMWHPLQFAIRSHTCRPVARQAATVNPDSTLCLGPPSLRHSHRSRRLTRFQSLRSKDDN